MGDVAAGDQVYDQDGRIVSVTWASQVMADRPCFKVTFTDGSHLIADADHQWVANTSADRRAYRDFRVVTTREMLDSGVLLASGRTDYPHRYKWQVPLHSALEGKVAEFQLHPYFLGFWLGDGTSANANLTIGDEDSRDLLILLADAGTPYRHAGYAAAPYRYLPDGNADVRGCLRDLGVLNNKHIPIQYLRADIDSRLALLAGLIDSDGHVDTKTGSTEIVSVKEALASDIVELVRTLGFRASVKESRAMLNGQDMGPRYRVTWRMRSGGGRLARKQSLAYLNEKTKFPDGRRARAIASIESVASVPVRCISVDSKTSTYLAGKDFIVTHNSRAGSEWIVDQVLKHPFDARGVPTEWLVIAETLSDARTICMEGPAGILQVLDRRKATFKYKMSPRPMVLFNNGSKIYTEGADNPDVGRGYNASGAWLDECVKWKTPRRSWYEGIMPSLRADLIGDHPRAFVTTTPKPIDLIQEWLMRGDGTVHLMRGSTFDNATNLSSLVLEELRRRYEGTTIGRQELHGELIEAFDGALFTRLDIANNRVDDTPDDIVYTVVGVDPSLTGEDDEMGIVVVSRDRSKHLYIQADRSIMAVGREAAREAWKVAYEWGADKIVCEVNLGKRWMSQVFHDAYFEMVDEGIFPKGTKPPIVGIDTKLGKRTRAEPVAMRCEQGRLHMVGHMPKLEDQMATFVGWGTNESPDRLDAMVHACRFLMDSEKKEARITSPRDALSTTLQSLWNEAGSYNPF